jgi:uncharacterized protein (TIGR01777 family)
MEKIVISGGTGLIGSHLCLKLQEKGYKTAVLSREKNNSSSVQHYYWDWEKNILDQEAIETADYIVHLAGVNIGDKRWTVQRQRLIISSRVKSAELIFNAVKESKRKPKAFISASAIGYYGTGTSEKIYAESDPPALDFLGETCRKWEESADHFEHIGLRVVKIRTGIVLTRQGGALAKLMSLVKSGFGSAIGTGSQYMPWIHIDDLCEIYIKAIEDIKMNGAYNAVAPDYVTNREFTLSLARALKKSVWLPPVPAIAMKMVFGNMADMLLNGSRISPDKITATGYAFRFSQIESALTDLANPF